MKLDSTGLKFLQDREGLRLTSYNNGDGWTIGYGNRFYENGTKVQAYQTISKTRAESLFKIILSDFEREVSTLLGTVKVSQNQFNALVSYAYNRGVYKFSATQLLKLVKQNPNNTAIKGQFISEWGTNQTFKDSLIARRNLESNLYFTAETGGTVATNTTIYTSVAVVTLAVIFRKKIKNFLDL